MREPPASRNVHDEHPRRLRSSLAVAGFSRYLRWYFARNFDSVWVARQGTAQRAPGRPLIVYTNHPSWWDPALFALLTSIVFPGRIGFGPMDAGALEQYRILRRIGVFGIAPDTPRGAAKFLRLSLDLLADPAVVLWLTAEGAFTDARRRPLRLRPGLAHLARRAPGTAILPLAIEYTFWNERKPEVLLRFGSMLDAAPSRSVADWTALLTRELTRAMDALAADSMARDPKLFVRLLRGTAGVGGVYDLSRRARAIITGRRFDPHHERPTA